MALKSNFLNKKEFIFTRTPLRSDAGSHLYTSVHGNLLSLTFFAVGADSLNAWTGRAARDSLKDMCHTRGHLTPMEPCQFTYQLICAWIICTHLISSMSHPSVCRMLWEETDGQKLLKVHYKLLSVARLEVSYIRKSNSNKLCTKIKTLHHCRIPLTDSSSQKRGI